MIECLCPFCKSPATFDPSDDLIGSHIMRCGRECEGDGTVWYLQPSDKWYHKVKKWFKRLYE